MHLINRTEGGLTMSSIAMAFLEDHLRNGGVTTIPSIGIVLTAAGLKDKTDAISPTEEEVKAAIQECIDAQLRQLHETTDPEERSKIQQTIEQLQNELADPSRYLF